MGTRELRAELKKLERIRDTWDNPDYNESVRKASRMSASSMLSWIDTSISDIGGVASDYRRTGDEAYLYELRRAVSILQALTEELMSQSDLLH